MIPLFKVQMLPDHRGLLAKTLASGYIGQGPRVDEFEAEFSKVSPYPIVAMNSCTSAIHATLMHLGVGPGDEVVTTALTCTATNAPILAVGARPVWADVTETGHINPASVATKITRRTKAIIGVNWTGAPADYARLKAFGLPVIEDAAHSPLLDSSCERGDYICYSFGPIKHFTTGDGGAVATAQATDRASLELLRWYGLDRRSTRDFRCEQNIERAGLKFHMNDINATIGLINLPGLRSTVVAHEENARVLATRLGLPFDPRSNYWVFPLRFPADKRDAVREFLASKGIAASQVHARNDKHTAYNFPNGALPGLDAFDATQLNVPCGWWLDAAMIDEIVAAVGELIL